MDCKITSTKKRAFAAPEGQQPGVGGELRPRRRAAAFTLIEMMVGSGLGLLVLGSILSFSIYSGRSFAAMANYLDLDQSTQLTLDKMSREIRQVNNVVSANPTNLTFQDFDGANLQYVYDARNKVLTRIKGSTRQTLLTGCDSLQFSVYQRTPSNGTFQPWPTSTVTNAKLVQLTWNCSRTILGSKANTESMQSAKVVIRKK